MEDMINLVLKCLKCKNNGIIFVSLNFLEIVRLFEPKYGESIKTKKFKIQNQVFENLTLRDLSNSLKFLKKNILIKLTTTIFIKKVRMTMMMRII
jgi:hypothetical protein